MNSAVPLLLLLAGLLGGEEHGRAGVPFCVGSPSADVSLAVELKDPIVEGSAGVTFTATIVNRGSKKMALATPLVFGQTLFLALETEGVPVQLAGHLVASVPGKPAVLEPGQELSIRRTLDHVENFTVPPLRPGRYTLVVCYRYPGSYDRRVTAKSAVWPELIRSGEVSFRVR